MLQFASLKKEKRVRHLGREQNADFERPKFRKTLIFFISCTVFEKRFRDSDGRKTSQLISLARFQSLAADRVGHCASHLGHGNCCFRTAMKCRQMSIVLSKPWNGHIAGSHSGHPGRFLVFFPVVPRLCLANSWPMMGDPQRKTPMWSPKCWALRSRKWHHVRQCFPPHSVSSLSRDIWECKKRYLTVSWHLDDMNYLIITN